MRRGVSEKETAAFVPLLEDAVSLLASLPASVWAGYLLGVIPFAVGLLAFCTVMWESTLAPRQLGAGALGVTVAFVWMKMRQTAFASAMLARINPVTAREHRDRGRRILRRQVLLQPLGLFVLPVTGLVSLLHPFAFSFFQYLTVCEALGPGEAGSVPERALRFAGRNQRQLAMYVLAGLSGLYVLVGLNWLMVLAIFPRIFFSLTGLENPFVQSVYAYFHVSFWLSAGVLTWVTLDPLNKAFYLLRGYELASERTGMDLRDRTRALWLKRAQKVVRGMVLGVLLLGAGMPEGVMAAEGSEGSEGSAEALRETIEAVSRERKFLWRAPPEAVEEGFRERGPFTQAILDALEWTGERLEAFFEWLDGVWSRLFPRRDLEAPRGGAWLGGIQSAAEGLMVVLAVVLAVVLGVLLWRAVVRHRRAARAEPDGGGGESGPDLNREEVLATELPADEWLKLVRELMGRGETRLALRALFLAYLARLADQNLLVITRYKSNRDYEAELTRRAHAAPGALPCYRELRRSFEAVWYGNYPAEAGTLQGFLTRVLAMEGGS